MSRWCERPGGVASRRVLGRTDGTPLCRRVYLHPGDFLSGAGQVPTLSAVNVVTVLELQLVEKQAVAPVALATSARRTIRAVHLASPGP